jgi:hypothetical protein
MKRRFIALRIISTLYKILAVVTFIGMVVWILLNVASGRTPTGVEMWASSNIIIGLVGGLLGTLTLLALGQLFDLLIAMEENTRAATVLLQRMGKLMQDRL